MQTLLLKMIFKLVKVNYRYRMFTSLFWHFLNLGPLLLPFWVWVFQNICIIIPTVCTTYKRMMHERLNCQQIKRIFSPKSRTLLLRVTTRMPYIGLGRAPPGTSLHSPADGRYISVEASWFMFETVPPVTNNTWIIFKECFMKIKLNFTLSLSWDRKLAHPWPQRPLLSPELKSSSHPCLPYLDTVVKV